MIYKTLHRKLKIEEHDSYKTQSKLRHSVRISCSCFYSDSRCVTVRRHEHHLIFIIFEVVIGSWFRRQFWYVHIQMFTLMTYWSIHGPSRTGYVSLVYPYPFTNWLRVNPSIYQRRAKIFNLPRTRRVIKNTNYQAQ